MSKTELRKVSRQLHKEQSKSRESLGVFSNDATYPIHKFKCAFCGLIHDKIELGSFSLGYPTSLKFEKDFSINLGGRN
jgi:hypothetical protein